MSVLVLNAGSSNLKFALFDNDASQSLAEGVVHLHGYDAESTLQLFNQSNSRSEEVFTRDAVVSYGDAVEWILEILDEIVSTNAIGAVGHRVVHGGASFHKPTKIDDDVISILHVLARLAPLHNPPAILAIETARDLLPSAVQVAVFDTAFFADLPPRAATYPVPYQWREKHGIRRFGFHGISHQYCSARAAEMLNRDNDASAKIVVCHLGSGCSISAVRGGHPIATTMGFTPMEGLMMGTRCGSIDPGILLHMIQHEGYTASELKEELNQHSGLLGVSGVSADYRQVQQAAAQGDERAQLAIDMFADRARATIGSMAVLLGGIDGLVFTGGIGENSANMRTHACIGLECLGLEIREDKNQSAQGDCDISDHHARGRTFVIHTREEQWIAKQACLFAEGVHSVDSMEASSRTESSLDELSFDDG